MKNFEELKKDGLVVLVGKDYLAEDGTTLIRCEIWAGRSPKTVWVRDDELTYVYRSVAEAFEKNHHFGCEPIDEMKSGYQMEIMRCFAEHFGSVENAKKAVLELM